MRNAYSTALDEFSAFLELVGILVGVFAAYVNLYGHFATLQDFEKRSCPAVVSD